MPMPTPNDPAQDCWAIVARTAEDASKLRSKLEAAHGDALPERLFAYTMVQGSHGFPKSWSDQVNIFHAASGPLYQRIWVDRSIGFPGTEWTPGLLVRLHQLLCEDGVLAVDAPPQQRSGCIMGADRIDARLGAPLRVEAGAWRIYPPTPDRPAPKTLLSWYMGSFPATLLELLSPVSADDVATMAREPLVAEFLRADALEEPTGEAAAGRTADLDTLAAHVGSMAYLFHGVGYKGAVISEIIRQTFAADHPVDYLDIGGANGALAAELLLQESVAIRRAHTHELSAKYLPLARQIYLGHREAFRGRFGFSLGSMSDYAFPLDYDVVSFIGSLYLSGPEQRGDVARRAFANLRPGGILIVHENLRDGRAAPSHDFMFDERSLRELLSGLGPVRCFHNTTGEEVPVDQVKGRTMFWAVHKPA